MARLPPEYVELGGLTAWQRETIQMGIVTFGSLVDEEVQVDASSKELRAA
jgi:hypothetical protein